MYKTCGILLHLIQGDALAFQLWAILHTLTTGHACTADVLLVESTYLPTLALWAYSATKVLRGLAVRHATSSWNDACRSAHAQGSLSR